MKNLLLTTVLMFAICIGTTNAQSSAKKHMRYYSEETLSRAGVNPEQKAKIQTLVDEANAKTKEIKGNATLSEAEKKAEYRAITSARAKAYWTILTKEQATKVRAMAKEIEEYNKSL